MSSLRKAQQNNLQILTMNLNVSGVADYVQELAVR
jgi:hypothetical protein